MGLQTHHKISASISILILICTFGLRAIHGQETTHLEQQQIEITPGIVEEIKAEDINADLERAESKDGQKSEIVKQIRRLNADGSYTVGYEADDGTFKIESRDVLGNVKGTYGYVDINGEIKRVSYIANNGTNTKTDSSVEETTTTPRRNKMPTTRRPQYSSSTNSPTRSSVIQTIPRRLRISSTISTERMNKDASFKSSGKTSDDTTTVIYATSAPTPKPYINIRPTPLPGTNMRQPEQLVRPEKLEINQVSKIQVSNAKETSTTKPVVEEVDEKDEAPLPFHTNLLRRQLLPDTDSQYDTQHQVVYGSQADDDGRAIYGTLGSTARPLFTTSSPRLPPMVLAARQRAAQIQSAINANAQSTTEKYYIKSSRRQETTETDPTTESTSENTYITQNPVSVQIPANREEGKRLLRRPAQRPHFIRVAQQQQQQQQQSQSQALIPTSSGYEAPRLVRIPAEPSISEQYLRETTNAPRGEQISEQQPIPARLPQAYYRNPPPAPTAQPSQYYVYPEQEPSPPYAPYPIPYPSPQPQYYNYVDRPPLTATDFERLLQILVYRQQQLQQRQPYSGYGPNPYIGYNPYNQYQAPYPTRPPPYFPYRPQFSAYSDGEGMYQAQSPISSAEPPMSYELQRLMPRKKQFAPRYFGAQQGAYSSEGAYATPAPSSSAGPNGYLPPDVREELLYRMLMLALQSETQQQTVAAPAQVAIGDSDSSTTTRSSVIFKKPVRSVQIIGEEP